MMSFLKFALRLIFNKNIFYATSKSNHAYDFDTCSLQPCCTGKQ